MANIKIVRANKITIVVGIVLIAIGVLYYAAYENKYLLSLMVFFGLIFLVISKLSSRKKGKGISAFSLSPARHAITR